MSDLEQGVGLGSAVPDDAALADDTSAWLFVRWFRATAIVAWSGAEVREFAREHGVRIVALLLVGIVPLVQVARFYCRRCCCGGYGR